jgi:competence protein ComEA
MQAGPFPAGNGPGTEIPPVYVAIDGEVVHPGTYGFTRPPDLQSLLKRAGGLRVPVDLETLHIRNPIGSGRRVRMGRAGGTGIVLEEKMSAFHKKTLGIPISINGETREGLTALPGIGYKIAGTIVSERARRNGFGHLDELLTVKGVGPGLYAKIKPFIIL